MDKSILENWNSLNPLTKEEAFISHFEEESSKSHATPMTMNSLINKFNYYLNTTLPFKYIKTSNCATNFINEIFEKYVDEETLIITSSAEHDNVKRNLAKHENVFMFHFDEIESCNFERFFPYLVKYKKFFVYFIGTQISTGEITSTFFLNKLNNLLPKNRIFVLDAVQEMFLLNRDYSMYDYVIGTAHALVRNFDIGICFCNDNSIQDDKDFDFNTYFKALEIMLSRKGKLFIFPTVMREYFNELVFKYNWIYNVNLLPNFISIKTKINFSEKVFKDLKKYEVRLESENYTNAVIRLRGQQFIQFPDMLINGLDKFNKLLPYLMNR